MNKTIIISSILSAFIILTATPVIAAGPRGIMNAEPNETAATRPGLLGRQGNLRSRAAIGRATLTAINGTTLTVTGQDGKTYTVTTDSNTQFRRRFWGKSSLSEYSVGDALNVIGQWTDDAHTTILARLVRDFSIQKRIGVFFGTVTGVTGSGWTVNTIRRGTQTVTVTTSTKFINRRGQVITRGDVVVGNRIRVRGLWDNKSNTITQVTEVKDFSLPPQPTGEESGETPENTLKPTATVAPSATPTP